MCPSPRQVAALISAATLSIRRFEGHILGLPHTARPPSFEQQRELHQLSYLPEGEVDAVRQSQAG